MGYEVVVPCHNGAATISETILSLQDQTLPPERITVVDDGSTDDIAAALRPFSAVELVRRAHSGLAATQNAALAFVRAELVAFVDADDLWGPEAGERLATLFRDRPRLAAAGVGAVRFWDGDPPPFDLLDGVDRGAVALDAAALWRGNPLVKSATMHRTAAIRQVQGWRLLPSSEDYDLLLRLYAAGFELRRSPSRLCLLRLRSASMTTRAPTMLAGHLAALKGFAASERACAELPRLDYRRRAVRAWCRSLSTAAFYGKSLGDVPALSAVDPELSDVRILEPLVRHPGSARLLARGLNAGRPVLNRLGVGRAVA